MVLPNPYPVDATVDGDVISVSKFGKPTVDNVNFLDGIVEGAIGNAALDTRLTAVESGKALKTTTVTAGAGLTGGGDLSANRSLAVVYGTAANTAAQGNDGRFTSLDSRATALEGRATTLEAINATGGKWVNTGTATITQNFRVPFDTAAKTASGITVSDSSRVFTVTAAGEYDIVAGIQMQASAAGNLWLILAPNGADGTPPTPWFAGNIAGIPGAGTYGMQASALGVPLAAGATVCVWQWYSQGNTPLVNPARQATMLSIQRRK